MVKFSTHLLNLESGKDNDTVTVVLLEADLLQFRKPLVRSPFNNIKVIISFMLIMSCIVQKTGMCTGAPSFMI